MYTEEAVKEDITKYLDGQSLVAIGNSRGVCLETVRKMLQRNGIKRRKRGGVIKNYSEELLATIVKEYDEGASQQSLSKKYGVSAKVISSLLHSLAIDVRQGGPVKAYSGGYRNYMGYHMVQVPDDSPFVEMRNTNKYTPEHRLVLAEHLGRPLTRAETVHHINGDKLDNHVENLELRQRNHGAGVRYRCSCCGSTNVVPY